MLLALCTTIGLLAPATHQEDDYDLEKEFQGWLERCVWIKREIQKRLLSPSPEVLKEHEDLLQMKGTGATALVDRMHEDEAPGRAILKRGGGAYFSFVTGSHSYDAEPDIQLENGRFSSGFAGLDFGTVYRLGKVDLATIDGTGEAVPDKISEEAAAAWPVLWQPIDAEAAQNRKQQRDPFWQSTATIGPVGSSYVVRTWQSGLHDVLVAFQIADRGPYGVTIVWRKLKAFPVERDWVSRAKDRHSDVRENSGDSDLGIAVEKLSLDSLFQQLELEIDEARDELLSVPKLLQQKYLRSVPPATSFAQREGFARVLERGTAAGILGDDVGCYYSFTRDTYGWSERPEIGLENEQLGGGYRHLFGLDLGALLFEDIGKAMGGRCPTPGGERLAVGWSALHEMRLVRNERDELIPGEGWARKLAAAGVAGADGQRGGRVKAIQGHTYLLRTSSGDGDQLMVVTVIEKDSLGVSLAWRILESFPIPASIR